MTYENPFLYPADLSPAPDAAWGQIKMRRTYAGAAGIVNGSTTIPFDGAGVVSASAIDAARGGGVARWTQWADQIGSISLTGSLTEAPEIADLDIDGVRALVFQGGSTLDGAMNFLAANCASLQINAQTHSIVAVIQPSTAIARNVDDALAQHTNTLAELTASNGIVIGRVMSDGRDTVGWSGGAGDSEGVAPNMLVASSPSVIGYITDAAANERRIWQGRTLRRQQGVSIYPDLASTLYVGRRQSSIAGKNNEAFDGLVVALLLWKNRALTNAQFVNVRRAFETRLPTALSPIADYNTVFLMSDSQGAGFGPFGQWGIMPQLQRKLARPTRFANFSISGSCTTPQSGPSTPIYAYMQGFFPTILQHVRASPRKNLLMVMSGGNDAGIAPPPAAADVAAANLELATQWKDAGGRVLICTGPPRAQGTDVFLNALNAALISGAATAGFTVADIASIPALSPPGVGNPNYIDAAHISKIGGDTISTFLTPIVDGLLGY